MCRDKSFKMIQANERSRPLPVMDWLAQPGSGLRQVWEQQSCHSELTRVGVLCAGSMTGGRARGHWETHEHMHQPGRRLEACREAFGSVHIHVNAQPPWVIEAAGDAQFLLVTNV